MKKEIEIENDKKEKLKKRGRPKKNIEDEEEIKKKKIEKDEKIEKNDKKEKDEKLEKKEKKEKIEKAEKKEKLIETKKVYFIEKILKHRILNGGKKKYFVKWKGYDDKNNTWVDEKDILDIKLIEIYEKTNKN